MKLKPRHILAAVAIWAIGLCASALDLPVKRVSGVDYYYYTLGNNESIADIARKFGLTRDDIVRNNPAVEEGIRRGMTLYFPVHEFPEDNESIAGQSSGRTGVNLPTRYKVQKGETLYGIARRFEISPDDIVALNPHANLGVRSGQILLIPHGSVDIDQGYRASPPTVPSVIPPGLGLPEIEEEMPEERRLRPVEKKPIVEIDPPEPLPGIEEPVQESLYEEVDSFVVDTVIERPSIALMLPLMLNEQTIDDRNARMATDFIRGFMLGANSMSRDAFPCDINIYDTQANAEHIVEILSEIEAPDIIIAHEEGSAGAKIPTYALEKECYMLNLFNSHDTTYLTNPYSMQANIPARMMYEKAAQALMSAYEDYTPVFLVAKGGRGEKMPFITYIQELYREKGVDPIELAYDGMLTSADTESLDLSGNYVFIPVSGALSEYNKFVNAILTLHETAPDPSSIALFGYPDWTTFRGDALESLHRIGAMIYSRFYCDENDAKTRGFIHLFEQTYGSRPLEQVPSHALLGYDSACYLLSNFANNDGIFTPLETSSFTGIQSTFMFEDAADEETAETQSGYVNTSLYIITFLPGQRVAVQVL